MQKLIRGIHHFQNHIFGAKRELFGRLALGQTPAALFITCSDSRISPSLITQTDPGDIFVIRNAGNLVPPEPDQGGEVATIEFAIKALKIRDIVVCGHSDCGAIKGLLERSTTEESMPTVAHWLRHAHRTVEIIEAEYAHLEGRDRLTAAVEENVIVQIENLRTHRLVEERLACGELKLHGWVYKFETGEIFNYQPGDSQFLPLGPVEDVRPMYPRDVSPLPASPFVAEQERDYSASGACTPSLLVR